MRLCFLLYVRCKERKGGRAQLSPTLFCLESRCTYQIEVGSCPVHLGSRASSQESKLLDEPITRTKLLNKRTLKHQEYNSHHYYLSLFSTERRTKETLPSAEQCKILLQETLKKELRSLSKVSFLFIRKKEAQVLAAQDSNP